MPRRKPLKDSEKESSPVGIGVHGEVFPLYCPSCGTLMVDISFEDGNVSYPEKQCPMCLTIYQLGSADQEGAKSPQDVILAPRDKEWLRKFGSKYLKGALPGSW